MIKNSSIFAKNDLETGVLTQEGVGDVYAEKKFGIPDEDRIFNDMYAEKTANKRDKDVLGIVDHTMNGYEINMYKNPVTVNKLHGSVRGIIDSKSGNLFIVNSDEYLHVLIAKWLNNNIGTLYPTQYREVYDNLDLLVPIQRVGRSNKFALAELTRDRTIENPNDIAKIEGAFAKAKLKNPTLEFEAINIQMYPLIESSNINEAEIMTIQNLPFKVEIEQLGGKIYSVGGAVRDEFLGKESKDLDILITGVEPNTLLTTLKKYGHANLEGESFAVIKFKASGESEDIDIAIPRTEVPNGQGGHKGFDVTTDHTLPIEDDLIRRDFTINAMAKDMDGNLIDPYNGTADLKAKIIRAVNPAAFKDDPLRMMRAVQFASRFGFTIEPETFKMIQSTANLISSIAAERIIVELEKIVQKGDPRIGIDLLIKTGLYGEIFGKNVSLSMFNDRDFSKVRTMAEFMMLMTYGVVESASEFYLLRFSVTDATRNKTYKEMCALTIAFDAFRENQNIDEVYSRSIAHNMYTKYPVSLNSEILPDVIKSGCNDLLSGKYPKTVTELAINGNDIMQAGITGKPVGDLNKSLLIRVYNDTLKNDRETLLAELPKFGSKEELTQEGVGDVYAEKKFGIPDENRIFNDRYAEKNS